MDASPSAGSGVDGVETARLSKHWLVLAFSAVVLAAPMTAAAQSADSLAPIIAQVSDAVCRNDVVLLGELPSHGEARAFQIKAGVVERLIERCGFDAVFFEAPIYDFLSFQNPEQLDNAIGRFWLTRELADFRKHLFERSRRGLVVAGLDDQVSATSHYARSVLPALIRKALPASAATDCALAAERNLKWTYDAAHPFDAAEKERLRGCAHTAAAASTNLPPAERTMLENFASYAERQAGLPDAATRDDVMARNAAWHIGRLPAGSKVVIWTATVHAARTRGALTFEPLGALLARRWPRRVASIGFTAYAGQTSMAGRPPQPLAEVPAESIEARATDGQTPWVFLNAGALKTLGRAPSRLLGKVTTDDWSTYFDGVVIIRNEVAPVFEPRR